MAHIDDLIDKYLHSLFPAKQKHSDRRGLDIDATLRKGWCLLYIDPADLDI